MAPPRPPPAQVVDDVFGVAFVRSCAPAPSAGGTGPAFHDEREFEAEADANPHLQVRSLGLTGRIANREDVKAMLAHSAATVETGDMDNEFGDVLEQATTCVRSAAWRLLRACGMPLLFLRPGRRLRRRRLPAPRLLRWRLRGRPTRRSCAG